jgi:hypothetical protein
MADDKKPNLRSILGNTLMGDPNKVLVPKDRVISTGQGCWNCLTGDSLILTPNGAKRLDFSSEQPKILSSGGWQTIDAWRESGPKEVVEVATTFGAKVRMTLDHRVLTDRGWIAACDLRASIGSNRQGNYKAGDEIRTMPETTNYSDEITVEEAELIGSITGDGWVNPEKGVGFGFSADRLDAWKKMLTYAGQRFSSAERPHLKKFTDQKNHKDFYFLEWRTAASRAWADTLDKKHVPPSIWRSTPKVIGAYLRGLFTTDGTLTLTPNLSVRFFQVTKSLITEIQLLLKTVGIDSTVYRTLRELPNHDLYTLTINRGWSIIRFAELANFLDKRRRDILNNGLVDLRTHGSPERIRSVTPAGLAPVYDVSVPTTENFYANGVLVHNCKHWDREKAKTLWTSNRQRDLQTALEISLKSPLGEEDPRIRNIRTMIDDCDHLVATGHLGVCLGGGHTEDGNPVGDLVTHAFMCDRWSGVSGASLARGEDGKLDPLPMERADKLKS